MCGLAGFLSFQRDQSPEQMRAVAGRMADTLRHRGPDDAGTWCEADSGIAFGFRRLAIVDLSPGGHQPMSSSNGRFTIVFNGEIYNHAPLRAELVAAGHSFRSHSDTEVLAEGFVEWGIEATIGRTIGMFAIATWDRQEKSLTLIRDRLGKKPLYYGRFRDTVLFGSELKALQAHPAFQRDINRRAINEFLHHSYLTDLSIYENVRTLPPASLITFPIKENAYWMGEPWPVPYGYWDFEEIITRGRQTSFRGTYDDAVEELDRRLTEAVGCRMVADVPLGAFLSGGIDSSLIVALMQKQSSRPVKTFTIGFEMEAYNEAPFARDVARHLRTDHTEMTVTAADAMSVIPRIPDLFDEPFADSSQIPTYLVSELARRHVTVALSGDGGDELFCGYRRYFESLDGYVSGEAATETSRTLQRIRKLPPQLRTILKRICQITGSLPIGGPGRLFRRAADIFGESGPNDRYLRNMSHWRDLNHVVIPLSGSGGFHSPPFREIDDQGNPNRQQSFDSHHYQQAWQAYDTRHYLPGDILTKVDRASMGVSLEARTPLLDHRVVEFAWSLPHEFLVQGRTGKRILRDVLARYVPRSLFERPKVGFGIPIGDWLRGPLRPWAEELIDEHRLKREGFLYPQPIRQKWREHLSGQTDWSYHLWDVLVFQMWLERQTKLTAEPPQGES